MVDGRGHGFDPQATGVGGDVPREDPLYAPFVDSRDDGYPHEDTMYEEEEEEEEFFDDDFVEGDGQDPSGPPQDLVSPVLEDQVLKSDSIDPNSIDFKQVMDLVRETFPSSVPPVSEAPFERCLTEGILVETQT